VYMICYNTNICFIVICSALRFIKVILIFLIEIMYTSISITMFPE